MTKLLSLPVGIENFEKLRENSYYYVDKTRLIELLLEQQNEITLFTRPRRFGKSLNMSMLKAFFEPGTDKASFVETYISQNSAICEKYMGKFPVISISFKGVSGNDYETARSMVIGEINRETRRYQALLSSDRLTENDKVLFKHLMDLTMEEGFLSNSLYTLAQLLQKHFQQRVIILIDEYDVPLAKANELGYYDKMLLLIRRIFEQTLKTNDSLHLAVLTGCLRVSRESIFTGLNNTKIYSITDIRFAESFGFTDEEVQKMLSYYGLERHYPDVKDWYDGYRFGNADIYCPWDVINYCSDLLNDPTLAPQNYWLNTSGNDIVRHFIHKMGKGVTKAQLEQLVEGREVTKEIHQELTYTDLYASVDNIWSILFTTGYLTKRSSEGNNIYQLAIPNMEIRDIFVKQILKLFKEDVGKDGAALQAFCHALEVGNVKDAEHLFSAYLAKTISIRDTFVRNSLKENFYHGILLGILGYKENWDVRSNREAGEGFGDIIVEIEDSSIGLILEIKYAENGDLEQSCENALRQIADKKYADIFYDEDLHTIRKYAISCYKKRCKIMLITENWEPSC